MKRAFASPLRFRTAPFDWHQSAMAALLLSTLLPMPSLQGQEAPKDTRKLLEGVTVESSRPAVSATPFSYSDVVAATLPSVVTVLSSRYRFQRPERPEGLPPNFDLSPQRPERDEVNEDRTLGSGVIVSAKGYVLTNHHVIAKADGIRVRVPGHDGDLPAKIVGSDPATDVALLKIEAPGLQPIKIADSNKVRQGDVVLAFGSPYGLEQTVTLGIVSAQGRNLNLIRAGYEDFIQTDATISAGNSGGALVDGLGRLVGINSASLTDDFRVGPRMGFAIPANLALKVAADLLERGRVVRGYLGLTMHELGVDETRSLLHRTEPLPAEVQIVEAGAPAEKAGFQRGDVILAVNEVPAPSLGRARYLISIIPPGTKARVKILRASQVTLMEAIVADQPILPAPAERARIPEPETPFALRPGLELGTLTNQMRFEKHLPATLTGVLVFKAPGAAEAGALQLQAGDVVTAINGERTASLSALKILLAQKSTIQAPMTMLKVWRAGQEIFVALPNAEPGPKTSAP